MCVCVSSLGLRPDGAEAQTLAVLSVGAEAAAELPPESDRTKSIRNQVAGRHKESEWAPAPPYTDKQTVSTQRRTEDRLEQLLNLQEGANNAELVRHRVSQFVEFLLMKQLLKSPHLLRESGDVATHLRLLLVALKCFLPIEWEGLKASAVRWWVQMSTPRFETCFLLSVNFLLKCSAAAVNHPAADPSGASVTAEPAAGLRGIHSWTAGVVESTTGTAASSTTAKLQRGKTCK